MTLAVVVAFVIAWLVLGPRWSRMRVIPRALRVRKIRKRREEHRRWKIACAWDAYMLAECCARKESIACGPWCRLRPKHSGACMSQLEVVTWHVDHGGQHPDHWLRFPKR